MKINIGDIIEIKTKIGFFYAQYTHKDDENGALIRVTKNCFDRRPSDLQEIVDAEVGIITFFPLSIAIHRKIFPLIGNLPVPKQRQKFPVFRVRGHVDREGRVKQWKFWNGEKTWPDKWLTNLTEEQKKLNIAGIWNDTYLIERLEESWTPETDLATIRSECV